MRYRLLGRTGLKAAELRLAPDEVERLSATTEPRKLYPQRMVERQGEGRSAPQEAGRALAATES